MLAALAAALPSTVDDFYGSSACPCVDPWTTRFGEGNGTLIPYAATGGVNESCAFRRHGLCLPSSYGTGCLLHDESVQPECSVSHSNHGLLKHWCYQKFCWVDPANCQRPHAPSADYPNASALGLTYSYATCGNVDTYVATHPTIAELQRQRATLRVTFPTSESSSVYTLTTLPPQFPSILNGTRRAGSVPEFLAETLDSLGIGWAEQPLSQSSVNFSRSSSYTACVHEVAINATDLCFGAPHPQSGSATTPHGLCHVVAPVFRPRGTPAHPPLRAFVCVCRWQATFGTRPSVGSSPR